MLKPLNNLPFLIIRLYISFYIGSAILNPPGNPEFYLRVQCQVPSAGDSFKDVTLTYLDVNKFSSSTQQYTYAFSGESNSTGNVSATLILRKNFDNTGTNYAETTLANFVIPQGNFQIIQATGFVFGSNVGQSVTMPNNVQLRLRLPVNSVFDVSLTDFILEEGSEIIQTFPVTTDAKFSYQSLPPAIPNPDGSSFYLPMVVTPTGTYYDDADIGNVKYESQGITYVNSLHPTSNRMLANGSQYLTAGYSPLGVPYARLQKKYWNSSINTPAFGTGASYLTANISALTPANQLRITTNQRGTVTNAADGTAPTGFTFSTPATGGNYGVTAYRRMANVLVIVSDFINNVPNASPGTSGFTTGEFINQANRKHVFDISTIAATTLGGKFFFWYDPANTYYVWFTVDGGGTDPAPIPGAKGIRVDLLSTYSAAEVCCFVLEAVSGYQISRIVTKPASAITAGAWFSINTSSTSYYIWYSLNGTGTDPKPSGKTGINVNILSADTDAQVATKTQVAINSLYFAVPNFQGMFFRAYDPNKTYDYDADGRISVISAAYGNSLGNFQFDEFLAHSHEYNATSTIAGSTLQSGANYQSNSTLAPTSITGNNETRPVNAILNAVIIY